MTGRHTESAQPPIGDYAFLSDCRTGALVSRDGSIDWCCFPRFDSGSAFGRLLDWDKGGYCQVVPTATDLRSARSYVPDSLVLQTRFDAAGSEARVTDCLTITGEYGPHNQLVRVIDGLRGQLELRVVVAARFDYGTVHPWIRKRDARVFSLIGGNDALIVSSDVELEVDGHDLCATVEVAAGERVRLSTVWLPPEDLDRPEVTAPSSSEVDDALAQTVEWWEEWGSRLDESRGDQAVRRSATVLRGLINSATGAVAAAPTTSLPEQIGGSRNWDYRYSWIRDSQFTVRSLAELGLDGEADGFRRFVERSAAGNAESLRIAYGLGGERRLTEMELDDLAGYRGSTPVRIGNAAAGQRQLDVFGFLLELAWRWHRRGRSPDDDYWRFLVDLVDTVADTWTAPDRGIWEVRGDAQHFVHSKVMCWCALDRGLRLAEECMRKAPTTRWAKQRDAVREAVEHEGYDRERGVYRRAFGCDDLDAALLLLPAFDYISYGDERMIRTTDAVREALDEDGLLRRYRTDDGMSSEEGAFIACSFWLTECLAFQNRRSEATEVYNRAIATANDLGLFSEEYDPKQRRALGNYPQALTHFSQIAASVALDRTAEVTERAPRSVKAM